MTTAILPVRVPSDAKLHHCSLDIISIHAPWYHVDTMEGMARLNYNELNDTIRYTMWSVFRAEPGRLPDDRGPAATEAQDYLDGLAAKEVVVRGVYDVAGLRADADYLIWWHAEEIEQLQAAYAGFRRTTLGRASVPVWSQTALHRPAEFNRSHVPAFLAEEQARKYVCVYPFVRSYEWYLLPDEERRALLAEHGKMARDYPDVRANTVASFALGDYEWILAFEADELHRIVDLMRHLRGSETRRHVRAGDPVLHRHPGAGRRAGHQPAVTVLADLRRQVTGRRADPADVAIERRRSAAARPVPGGGGSSRVRRHDHAGRRGAVARQRRRPRTGHGGRRGTPRYGVRQRGACCASTASRSGAGWADLSGDYRAADGWVRLHCNYPQHAAGGLPGARPCPSDRGRRRPRPCRRGPRWRSRRACIAAGGAAAALRTAAEWRAHPAGGAVRGMPLVDGRPDRRRPATPRCPTPTGRCPASGCST